MSRNLGIGVAVICLAVGSTARASSPSVAGPVAGLELAQQTALNPAIFVGGFVGNVNGKFAFGVWAAGIDHETPLPDEPSESVEITGGQWYLDVWVLKGFRFQRVALGGGITGDLSYAGTDLFSIDATMQVNSGGSGDIHLGAILDHTVFPPGVSGQLSQ